MEKPGYKDVLQHDSKLLTTLLEVSNLVSSTMEIRPLLEAILDKLRTIIEYKNARIFIYDGKQLKVIAQRSGLEKGQEDAFRLPLEIGLVQEKKPIVIDDLYSDDELAVAFRNNAGVYMDTMFRDVRCWMCLPMIYKNEMIGVMTLDHAETGYYKAHHVELGTAFASQAAIEYENAKLYNETVKRADELKTLFSIQQAITSRLELNSVLRLIAGEARRLTNSSLTAVFLADEDELVLSVLSGADSEGLVGMRMPIVGSSAGESLQRHGPVILNSSEFKHESEKKLVESVDMHTCLYVPLLAGSRAVGVIAAYSSIDGEFNSEDIRIFNMFAPSAVIGIENARLYQESNRRLQENEQRRRVAEGLRDILKALNSDRSLDEILNFIIKEAAMLLHTDAAALFKLSPDKKELILDVAYGLPYGRKSETGISVNAGILGKAFLERRPVVMADLPENPMPGAYPVLDEHMAWLCDSCRRMLAVPLICKEEVYGVIALYFKKDGKQAEHEMSKEDIGLAMSIADQAALAIDNTRLKKQAEEMAVAAERNRLARDLHDAVTQTLFSASLIAEVTPRIWERNEEEGKKRLEELRQLTRGALAEMRTLLFELRPATLVEAPLEELLRQLSEAIIGRARIPISLDIRGKAALPVEVKITFYRIAQEALNNIAKHSGAKNASVELKVNEDGQLGIIIAALRIADDGRGFDPRSVTSEHFGLGIMKERAAAVGATLKIESSRGKGTIIELEWVGSKQTW